LRNSRNVSATKERKLLAIGKTIKLAGGFIIGFYTHVVGIVMERVRTNLIGDQAAVPDDHKSLYDQAADEIRGELERIGQSQMIAQILRYPLSAMCHYLESYNCKFRLLCDPRESKEDKAVQVATDDYVRNHFGRALPKEAALSASIMSADCNRHLDSCPDVSPPYTSEQRQLTVVTTDADVCC
jgi:hypothetical protein